MGNGVVVNPITHPTFCSNPRGWSGGGGGEGKTILQTVIISILYLSTVATIFH